METPKLVRFVPPKWAKDLRPFEGQYSYEQMLFFNQKGYNVYFFPNYPSPESYDRIPINPNSPNKRKSPVSGQYVDTFEYVFVDLDMKHYKDGSEESHDYETKEAFVNVLLDSKIIPTIIVDTGNGIHAHYRVTDLTAKTFLRLNRRMMRHYNTDRAVSTLNQLMRVPNTLNTKEENNFKLCSILFEEPKNVYTSEDLDKFLPPIQLEDETYCETHYNMIHNINDPSKDFSDDKLPVKFLQLCKTNKEASEIFYGQPKDRSIADFRLGHLMQAAGMTSEEATVVLMNGGKASERTKQHRYTYATNIVDKIWVKESETKADAIPFVPISRTIHELLNKDPNKSEEGTRIHCNPLIDATERGFRLGDVMGVIGGSGNGKSRWCLNTLLWFAERNPEYDFMYVSLEQPIEEIGEAWLKMTKDHKDQTLKDKIHILGNYEEDGTYRELSLDQIKDYTLKLEQYSQRKIGCIILDHIGVLKQEKRNGEFEGLRGIAKRLKAFAKGTNTFTVVQSQTSREKNGGGDMELDMTAAFGVSDFENFSDVIFTLWQPLRRVYKQAPHLTVTAYKMCKTRHMNVLKDKIKRDAIYLMKFDPETDRFRDMTSDEHKQFEFWSAQATALRNRDRKKDPSQISVVDWLNKGDNKVL